jgi:hypothetical protein
MVTGNGRWAMGDGLKASAEGQSARVRREVVRRMSQQYFDLT